MLIRTCAWSLGVEVITKAQASVVDVIQAQLEQIIRSFNDFHGIVGEVTENLSSRLYTRLTFYYIHSNNRWQYEMCTENDK